MSSISPIEPPDDLQIHSARYSQPVPIHASLFQKIRWRLRREVVGSLTLHQHSLSTGHHTRTISLEHPFTLHTDAHTLSEHYTAIALTLTQSSKRVVLRAAIPSRCVDPNLPQKHRSTPLLHPDDLSKILPYIAFYASLHNCAQPLRTFTIAPPPNTQPPPWDVQPHSPTPQPNLPNQPPQQHNTLAVPGERVGPITLHTTHIDDILKAFGSQCSLVTEDAQLLPPSTSTLPNDVRLWHISYDRLPDGSWVTFDPKHTSIPCKIYLDATQHTTLRIEIGPTQRRVVIPPHNLSVDSSLQDLRNAFGAPERVSATANLTLYDYPSRGILFYVDPPNNSINSFEIYPKRYPFEINPNEGQIGPFTLLKTTDRDVFQTLGTQHTIITPRRAANDPDIPIQSIEFTTHLHNDTQRPACSLHFSPHTRTLQHAFFPNPKAPVTLQPFNLPLHTLDSTFHTLPGPRSQPLFTIDDGPNTNDIPSLGLSHTAYFSVTGRPRSSSLHVYPKGPPPPPNLPPQDTALYSATIPLVPPLNPSHTLARPLSILSTYTNRCTIHFHDPNDPHYTPPSWHDPNLPATRRGTHHDPTQDTRPIFAIFYDQEPDTLETHITPHHILFDPNTQHPSSIVFTPRQNLVHFASRPLTIRNSLNDFIATFNQPTSSTINLHTEDHLWPHLGLTITTPPQSSQILTITLAIRP